MEFDQFSEEHFDESISIREVVEKYIIHLKWFILSILFFGVLAYLKVYYETPEYSVKASILIKDQERGNSINNLSAFEDMDLLGMGNNSLQNEMQILNSRYLMTSVVEELKLNYRYFIEDSRYDREFYPYFPIIVNIKSDTNTNDRFATSFKILVKSKTKFEFFDPEGNSIGIKNFGEEFYAEFGNEINSDKRKTHIVLNKNFDLNIIGKTIVVSISSIESTTNSFMGKLVIEPIDQNSSDVINLTLEETVKEKGIAVINNLIDQYNLDGINDKNLISRATTQFLDDRLILISAELSAIEGSAAQFKTNKGLVDVNSGANVYLESSTVTEREMVTANTQLEMVNYMLEQLQSSNFGDLLPGNIGLSDPAIINLISNYNDLVLQRNRVLKSSSIKNPIIVSIDSQLDVLNNNLISSLNNLKTSSEIQINALNRKGRQLDSKIASAPRYEKEYKDIVREQETKNALYLFLLQKREESILSNSVSVDKAKVIDQAYSSGIPIFPKKSQNYLGAIFLGILVPFLIIFIKDLMDTKVHDEQDLKRLKIPYIGDIPLSSSKNLNIVLDDNSPIAEAFRYVRTNINFMLEDKNTAKTVLVTSTQSHEGKTFTAINLASTLAMSGKKTLLLAMDLRAPKITEYLNIKDDLYGVTHFVKDSHLSLADITKKHPKIDNLQIINSGEIPPNPVELLMSERIKELFEEAKKNYDFIIVDTAPVGMVTDVIQIGRFADITIYVIRANYLDKRMLHIPEKIHREKKLQNMALLINASDHSKGAYGYGYGYGYGNKKKAPWYKRGFGSTKSKA